MVSDCRFLLKQVLVHYPRVYSKMREYVCIYGVRPFLIHAYIRVYYIIWGGIWLYRFAKCMLHFSLCYTILCVITIWSNMLRLLLSMASHVLVCHISWLLFLISFRHFYTRSCYTTVYWVLHSFRFYSMPPSFVLFVFITFYYVLFYPIPLCTYILY